MTRPSAAQKDWICILILLVSCLAIRVPSLDRIALNPDESQFEATAAYLLATERSAFSLSYGPPGAVTLYKAMAWIFGPYPMFEVRLLVLLLCLGMAVLLFLTVRRETSHVAGTIAGLVLLHYSHLFEGLSANREWFANAFIVAGLYLYSRAARRRAAGENRTLLLCGFVCALALWFKIHAALLILSIPLALAWRLAIRGGVADHLRRIVVYGIGAAIGFGTYLVPFTLSGTLSGYLGALFTDWRSYVVANEAAVQAVSSGRVVLYLQNLYWGLPVRALLLAPYALMLICIAALARRLLLRRNPRNPLVENETLILFVCYLLTALVSIKLGNRFFGHYYLFMLPAVGALCGFAVHALACLRGRGRSTTLVLLVPAVVLVLERLLAYRGYESTVLTSSLPYLAALAIAAVLFLAWGGLRTADPRSWTCRVVAALLFVEIAVMMVLTERISRPTSLPNSRNRYERLIEQIHAQGVGSDRLFVWGWAPEIYSLSRLEPASHFSIAQFIVGDYVAQPAGAGLNREFAAELMLDLVQREPRLVVDASRRSWTMVGSGEPWLYDLGLYPDFELPAYLRAHYDNVGRFDGCDLYVRRRESVSKKLRIEARTRS